MLRRRLAAALTEEEARQNDCACWCHARIRRHARLLTGLAGLSTGLAAAQAPLEATLTEEEARRNSRRLDLLYMASSHPVAPDVFQLCDAAGATDEAARASLERPLDPQLSGARPHAVCASALSA